LILKNNHDPCSHKYCIACMVDRYSKLQKKFYLGNNFRLLQICIIGILVHNNVLHDLTLIKMFVTCFMGIGSVSEILMVIKSKHIAK
jgi:hypothetical protein